MLYKSLPRREARGLEAGLAQPERHTLYALDAAAIRTKGSVKHAIAEQELEW